VRKVAVTGGSGQLGAIIVRRLLARSEIDAVVCIDRAPPRIGCAKLQFIEADIRDRNLDRHLVGCDTVVHCAFLVTANAPADVYQSVNVDGSKNVFRCAATAGSGAIVYMSSIAAYGCVPGHPVPITEDTPRIYQPSFHYSACKFEVEAFLDGFEREHPDIAICRIRPNILLGRSVPHALGRLLRKGQVPPTGRAPLPIVADEDVADLVLLAIEKRARGAFNAGVEELLTGDELAEKLGMTVAWIPKPLVRGWGMLDRALKLVRLHLPYDTAWITSTQDITIVVSSLRAKNELGWRPAYPTASAVLRRFLETAPRRLDRRLTLALWLIAREGRRQEENEQRICAHLCIEGEYGRDCAVIAAGQRIRVRQGAPKFPTSAIFVSSTVLCGLLAGTIDLDRAVRNDEVRTEGNGYDILRWLIETFTLLSRRNSLAGRTARFLMRSFSGEQAPLLVPSTHPKTEPSWPRRSGPSL
jgi:nucleoside-diphosphate-sugar epimerase